MPDPRLARLRAAVEQLHPDNMAMWDRCGAMRVASRETCILPNDHAGGAHRCESCALGRLAVYGGHPMTDAERTLAEAVREIEALPVQMWPFAKGPTISRAHVPAIPPPPPPPPPSPCQYESQARGP